MWDKIFNRDQLLFGILLGIVLPVILYLALYAMDIEVYKLFDSHIVAKPEYLFLLSVVINLFPMRYYFVNLKYDKTGRGVLLVTLILTLSYFLVPGLI
jgi:hypothetical protein